MNPHIHSLRKHKQIQGEIIFPNLLKGKNMFVTPNLLYENIQTLHALLRASLDKYEKMCCTFSSH